LELPINQVTGRVNELDKMGLITLAAISDNEQGRKVKYWVSKDLNDINLLRITEKKPPRFDNDGVRV
jgi:hypothetical protein